MKLILLSCLLLGATYGYSQSSLHKKQVTQRASEEDPNLHMHYGVEGVVRVEGNEPCDLWIMVSKNDRVYRYTPLNLPEEFKVDGSRIVFDYGLPVKSKEQPCVDRGIYVMKPKVINPSEEK